MLRHLRPSLMGIGLTVGLLMMVPSALAQRVLIDPGQQPQEREQIQDSIRRQLEELQRRLPGEIRLFFKTDPDLKLKSWIITDAQGVDTRIDLSNMERDVTLSAELFEFSEIGLPTFNR